MKVSSTSLFLFYFAKAPPPPSGLASDVKWPNVSCCVNMSLIRMLGGFSGWSVDGCDCFSHPGRAASLM